MARNICSRLRKELEENMAWVSCQENSCAILKLAVSVSSMPLRLRGLEQRFERLLSEHLLACSYVRCGNHFHNRTASVVSSDSGPVHLASVGAASRTPLFSEFAHQRCAGFGVQAGRIGSKPAVIKPPAAMSTCSSTLPPWPVAT